MAAGARAMAVVTGAAAVALGYVLAQALGWPMVWFDSATRVWSAGPKPSSAAMDFFGRSLWALGCGGVAATAAWLVFRRRGVGPSAARWVAVAAATVVAVSFGLEVRRLIGRTPVSEELPAGYDPITGRLVDTPVRVVHR